MYVLSFFKKTTYCILLQLIIDNEDFSVETTTKIK